MPWEIFDPSEPNENVVFGGPGSPSTRLAPNFNGVSQYAEFSSPTVYTGDFEISVNAMLPESIPASNVAFFGGSGGSGSGAFTLFINSSGQSISAQIPTSSGNRYDLSTDINQYLGLTIELKVARVSGVWSLLINGATVDTYDSNPHGVIDQEVANIGRWSTTLYYQGVVYDYADSLGSNFPMDDGWANNPVMRNSATELGVELIYNNDFSSQGDGWNFPEGVTFEGDALVYDGVTNGVIYQNVNITSGTVYLFTIEVKDVVRNLGLQPRVQIGSNGYKPLRAISDGVYQAIITSDTSGSLPLFIELGVFGIGAEYKVEFASLRQADGYGEFINMTEASWVEIPA